MRISFDLDGTLFVSLPEQADLPAYNFVERGKVSLLRKESRKLIKTLVERGWEICFYTNSLRARSSLHAWAMRVGIPLTEIINQQIHENKCAESGLIPAQVAAKMPAWFGIDLHVDDSPGIAGAAEEYGFEVCLIEEADSRWAEKVLSHAHSVAERKSASSPIAARTSSTNPPDGSESGDAIMPEANDHP